MVDLAEGAGGVGVVEAEDMVCFDGGKEVSGSCTVRGEERGRTLLVCTH
jgi:hypothetical protein